MQTSGQARTEIDIVDASVIVNSGLKGVVGVCGITERGLPENPVLIGSWLEYTRNFGSYVAGSIFPQICKRTLDGGGRLKISRAAHYSNPADKTTIDGVKSTLGVTQGSVSETKATSVYTFTAIGGTGDKVSAVVNTGLGLITLGTYAQQNSDTTTLLAVGLKNAINALTTSHGYTAANTGAVLTITAPTGSGAAANAYIPMSSIIGAITLTIGATTFTGGVTAQTVYALTATAKSIGAWGNGLTFQFKAPANNIVGTLDLVISLSGYSDLTETYSNITTAFTSTEVASVNAASKLITFSGVSGTLCASNVLALSTGVQNVANIVTADYVGDSTQGTGLHAFDDSMEITKISVPEIADPVLDTAMANYADLRKDLRAVLRTPVGLDGQGIVAYRNGTSPYSFTPVNTWRASMFTGGLKVIDPQTGLQTNITEIGDVLAAYSRKDNITFEWFSVAGSKRGVINNALGVVYNLGSPARALQADAVDTNGVNAVITHPSFGNVIWGNSTLQKAATLLSNDNVADLMIYLQRGLRPLIESESFDPNDIETWKNIYRRVTPLMEYIKTNRGIWKYLYQGDQDIDNISQAKVNSTQNIDAGQYVFNLFISPKVGMKYSGVKVIVANSGVDFQALSQTI